MTMQTQREPILSVRGLKKGYPIKSSALLAANRKVVHAVDGVDLDLYEGETLGLVGESGCGKSTVGRLLAGIEKPTEGTISYQGMDLVHMKNKEMRRIRTQLQMIFQDPYSSLNPRKRVYDILADPMLYHGLVTRQTAAARVDELLGLVGLPKSASRRYPHEFSGGQRQRICIARALSLNPRVIICDEPVSALDMSIQAQILNLLKDLQKELDVTYLFIAHGLGAVHYISPRIAIMYLGKIVEISDGTTIFREPLHPYAQMLIRAVPLTDPQKRQFDEEISTGEVPSAVDLPQGCRFAQRCPYATEQCRTSEPSLRDVSSDRAPEHLVACWHAGEPDVHL